MAAEPATVSEPATAAEPDTVAEPSPEPATDRPARATRPSPKTEPAVVASASSAPVAPTSTPPTGDASAIDELRARWPEVVAFLSQSPPVKPLIEACRPISVEDHLVTLGFPEDKAFLKIALERRGPILEEGIGRVLGRAVNVRCVATNLEHVPAVAIEAESADLISEARRIFAEDLVDVCEVS